MQRSTISRFLHDQGHEPRRRRNDCVAKATGNDEAGAVASALWKRLTAGCEHNGPGVNPAGAGREREAVAAGRDIQHPLTGQKRGAGAAGFAKQCVEHVAGAVAVGKELAAGLFVNAHADPAEKFDRLVHRKCAQYATDDSGSPSPEIVLGDDGVGDVAARPAADENLGARLPRTLDQGDRARGILSSREDCSRKAGCAGADYRNVVCGISFGQRRKLMLKVLSSR